MGGLKKVKTEGGSGGKRGHSGMKHWVAGVHPTEIVQQSGRLHPVREYWQLTVFFTEVHPRSVRGRKSPSF
jgi:hypothetical protein